MMHTTTQQKMGPAMSHVMPDKAYTEDDFRELLADYLRIDKAKCTAILEWSKKEAIGTAAEHRQDYDSLLASLGTRTLTKDARYRMLNEPRLRHLHIEVGPDTSPYYLGAVATWIIHHRLYTEYKVKIVDNGCPALGRFFVRTARPDSGLRVKEYVIGGQFGDYVRAAIDRLERPAWSKGEMDKLDFVVVFFGEIVAWLMA